MNKHVKNTKLVDLTVGDVRKIAVSVFCTYVALNVLKVVLLKETK